MLGLRPTSARRRRPAAWFLPGTPADWLRELERWEVSLAGPILLVVPGQGVLVRIALDEQPSARAQPYGLIGGKLYVPAESELTVAVSAAELGELPEALLVLHPRAGLVGARPEDLRTVGQLITPPPRRAADWGRAQLGAPPLPTLREVAVVQEVRLEQLLAGAGEEIGASSPEELPPEPDEPSEGSDPVRWAGGQFAKAARWLTGKDAGGDSWIDRLERWSAEKREQLRELRSRELERLLGLMERDPDEGLRFALPLAGGGARGRARPGATLPPRDMDLDLGGPRGGEPADPWEVDPELFAQLRARYREAANRELNLGRHVRAAYIYLELLGDVDAAALALERGRHYREAAQLYTERLGRPLDAARCLERGGLLAEAVAIYRAERRFETAAGLLERLGREEEARATYREAAEQLRESGDVRGAVVILEARIDEPDLALEWLAATWPHGSQASGCLKDRFDLLGRLGRHGRTTQLLREFQQSPAPPAREAVLVETLARVARTYPDAGVRGRARDTTRVVAGRELGMLRPATAERLLRAVARVEPQDELLARDVRRAIARLRREQRPEPRPAGRLEEPEWLGEFRLPLDVRWEVARQPADPSVGFYAVGQGEQGPVVLRALWSGQLQWRWWSSTRSWPANLLLDCALPAVVVAYEGLPESARLPRVRFPATEEFPEGRLAETPGWLPAGTLAFSCSESGLGWAVYPGVKELTLACVEFSGAGFGITTRSLGPLPSGAQRLILQAIRSRVAVAAGRSLTILGGREPIEGLELPHAISRLGAAGGSTPILHVSCEEGAALVWLRARTVEVQPFATGMSAPHVAVTDDGRVVAINRYEARVYSTRGYGVEHLCTFPGPGHDVVALLNAGPKGKLAVIGPNGRVRSFRLPRG